MAERVYLDWNATAPLRDEAREAMRAALDIVGNPSSIHAEGRAARGLIEKARAQVAALVGAEPGNVIFTSGGTEANNLALTPAIEDGGDKAPRVRLLVSAVEHPSVAAGGRFARNSVDTLPVDGGGTVELDGIRQRMNELQASGIRPLVAIMHANNETGVVQPVAAAAEIVHRAGGLLMVDAVQSAGKIPCDIKALGADFMTLSAHKLGGPKGVGALVKAREALHMTEGQIRGGGQERGARAGTENISGISGFGAAAAAAQAALEADRHVLAERRNRLEERLLELAPATVIFGRNSDRLPNTIMFAVPGARADTALIALDLVGFAVSSGSACSSGKVGPSPVLAAMGVDPALAACAIRISIGSTTTDAQIELFLKAWRNHIEALSKDKRGLAA